MANKHASLDALFADIADAIREKTGDTASIVANDFPAVILERLQVIPQVTLISFTIDGTTYQAQEGMTWAEWVNSDYDTPGLWNVRPDGFVCGNTRIDLSPGYVADSSYKDVKPSDVIQANYAYLLGSFGGN